MIRRYLKTRAGKVLAVLTGFIFLFLAADLLWPAKKDVKYATLIKARDGEVLHMFLTHDEQWRFRAELNEITPELSKAIIFKEDKYFYYHPGINIVAIIRAAVNNLVKGRRTSGASTITMQVARMLEPKKRSYVNKLVEMWRALQLELHLSKDEILQLYFNLLPYGSNIQGVKAASLLYFDKSPDQLSLAEITALSIIPNRPNSLVMGKDNLLIEAERNKWLSRYEESKLFPPAVIHDAKNEPLLAYRHPAPQVAPQFAYRLRKMYPGSRTIFSTIDKAKQTQAEAIIGAYSNKLKLSGINNASVIVLDNQTHEVLCYVGSSDFRDRINHGQVDGVQALRSPGSTLKPLLYGLAFDAGLATPKTKIADVPTNFKGYVPENYDLNFRGNIAAEDALKLSLNIPAVKLLNEISVPAFITALS